MGMTADLKDWLCVEMNRKVDFRVVKEFRCQGSKYKESDFK